MQATQIKQIIERNQNNIAFVIGNGINRYANERKDLSWEDLLVRLWQEVTDKPIPSIPAGISLTEFYDVLELENTKKMNLQKKVSQLMVDWNPSNHHKRIVDKIRAINAPVLTTNFDEALAKTFDCSMYRTTDHGFTDFYPWTTYHGSMQHHLPTDGFGIWYINGMVYYRRSIRLGLNHYLIGILSMMKQDQIIIFSTSLS